MKINAYKMIHITLVLVLILMPVVDVYANQYQLCDSNEEIRQEDSVSVEVPSDERPCHQQKADKGKCCCDTDPCNCTSVSHVYISISPNKNIPLNTFFSLAAVYSSQLNDVYIPSGLRPPIA